MADQTSQKPGAGAEPTQRDPNLGKIVNGKWRIHEQLGKGGAGIVYGCVHTSTGQVAAVKLLRTSWEENEELLNRFFREVQILRRLRHTNIVEIFDVGFQEEVGFFLVMERLEGCDLRSRVERDPHPMPWRELAHIANQVCEAMAFAHNKGVIHRDLKPANIFLLNTPSGLPLVKMLDFGIAKALTEDDTQITKTGMMVGSPAYLAPEQAMGFPVDKRADLYSLSVILFELLTQSSLFEQDNSFRYMMHHVYTPPRSLSQARPDIRFPLALEELVLDGLAKQPESRPSDMLEFKRRLLDALMEGSKAPSRHASADLPGTYRMAGTEPEALQPSPQEVHIRQAKLQLVDGTNDTMPTSAPATIPPSPKPSIQPELFEDDDTPPPSPSLMNQLRQAQDPLGQSDELRAPAFDSTLEEDMESVHTPLPSPKSLDKEHAKHRASTPVPTNTRMPSGELPRGKSKHSEAALTASPASLGKPKLPVGIRSRSESLANQLATPQRSTPMRGTPNVNRSRRHSSAMWQDAELEEQRKRRNYLIISFAAITLLLLVIAAFIGR